MSSKSYNAVFALLAINLVVYVLDQWVRIPIFSSFYLHVGQPSWYQFITSLFCHASWSHLSGNLFFLYIFGKIIEEQKGSGALIASYLICGIGANLMSYFLLSAQTISLGASGAVFGLFTVGMLIKLKWQWQRIIEVLILGQFVIAQIIQESQHLGQNDGINRVAHVGGALVGVLVVYLLAKWGQARPNK